MMKNPYGYFDDSAREYVMVRPDTPLPWLNYLGQDEFFALCTNTGGGYTFYKDAKLRRLTRYRYNNIPYDSNGRYLYIKDGDSVWNPTWKPVKAKHDKWECRHGLGYTRFLAEKDGIEVELLFFIPPEENVEIWRTKVRNKSGAKKSIQLFSYVEFCFYEALNDMTNFQRTFSIGEVEVEGSAIYHKTEFRERRDHYTLFGCTREIDGFDTSRDVFVGVHNGLHEAQVPFSGKATNSIAHGWNPIGSHALSLELEPGAEEDFAFVLAYVVHGHENKYVSAPKVINKEKGQAVMAKYSDLDALDAAFGALKERWEDLLGAFQMKSPSEPMNRMGNTWNQVQTMATFNLSRSASMYESGIGRGMGYRDSNQDLLGFVHLVPDKARQRVLDIAATQMSSGLCFHQYQPLTKKGNADVGGGFMDDHLWLILSTCAYIKETGDLSILSENIGYADQPDDAKDGTLLDHLELSLRYCLENRGPHQLPLIGHADWNDCLNLNCYSTEPNESFQLASHGTDDDVAESLMIAGLFMVGCNELRDLYRFMDKEEDASRVQGYYNEMLQAVDAHGWDGEWFLRAYDAKGEKVGSKENPEGSIYIESQGWLIMAGVGLEDGRAAKALESVHRHLYTENGCVLQQPPYKTYHLNLGEVSSYPPGYKENAGIFCHNNPWIHFAHMLLGNGDRAYDYYLSICPAAKEEKIDVYRGEPYVYSQMVAGKDAATPGEAKNAWLTGTAAWTFLSVSQGFMGVKPAYHGLQLDPCIPSDWPGFEVTRRFRGATYEITVKNPRGACRGVASMRVNGETVEGNVVPLAPSGSTVKVEIELGQ